MRKRWTFEIEERSFEMEEQVFEIEDRLFDIGERLFENEESFCSKRRLHIFSNFLTKKKGEIENSKNKGGLWFLSVVPLKNGTPLSDTHSLHTQH